MIKAVFFDLSGVLYMGDKAIPGAIEAVNRIQQSTMEVRFVTNTSRMNRQQILTSLTGMGLSIESNQLFSAVDAAKELIRKNQWRPYCLIHENITADFTDIDQSQPNAVLIGDAENGFCYSSLDTAFQLCQAGAPLIGIGRNRYFKLGDKLHLDAGPFIHAIEYAASTNAIITGKPSSDFFNLAAASVEAENQEILMVGDDVHGDIEGAINAAMQGCLVKTGKYQSGDEKRLEKPFSCVETVADAVSMVLN